MVLNDPPLCGAWNKEKDINSIMITVSKKTNEREMKCAHANPALAILEEKKLNPLRFHLLLSVHIAHLLPFCIILFSPSSGYFDLFCAFCYANECYLKVLNGN